MSGSSAALALVKAIQIPVALLSLLTGSLLWPQQATLENNSSYDYIVVGAGSAGCVVASRLVEDKNSTVLLLEAGGDPPVDALLAALFALLPGSSVDNNFTSTRDDYAARSQNNYTMLTAGKMLGGSDSMNHFLHTRGSQADYNGWAEMLDDESWNYENVLPYFIKSERVVDDKIIAEYGTYHGTDGPMGITRQLEDDKVANILKAFAEVGNPTVSDLNADTNIGYTQPQYMLADKKRQTPAYSYLKPVKDYSNLYVSKNTRVTKIIFENKVAVAVEAVYEGKTYTFRANKEIIICAGVYNTPQLLMLSGVGPKEHLETFDIDVISDLPVGDNLQDQVSVTLVHKLEKHLLAILNPISLLESSDPTKIPFPILVGSVPLNKSLTCPDYQTYNLLLAHDTPFLTLACAVVFGLRNEICDRFQKQVESRDSFYTVLALLQPKSTGNVRLSSTNPFDDPLITTGYFKNDEDLQNMVKFVMDFKEVAKSTYFQKIGAELVGLDLEECADKEEDSVDYWTCYILNHASSPYHTTSTCSMGNVLDSKLNVKGVERLRVVDASAIPKLPRGAPNAAVIMLAEKASDIIKSDNCS